MAWRPYLDMILVTMPLTLGFVEPVFGSYAVLVVIVWFGAPRLTQILRGSTLEILVAVSVLVVLVSPLWQGAPSPDARSAALGAALGVAYFLPVMWAIRRDVTRFVVLARVLVWQGIALGVVILLGGVPTEVDGDTATRLFVDFANANYAAAALATTASITALLLMRRVPEVRHRMFYFFALAVQVIPLYQLGSRAALVGVGLAFIGAIFLVRTAMIARVGVFVVMIITFVAGWFPVQLAEMLALAAEPLSQFSSLARSQASIESASGRLALWESTAYGIQQSPLVGWGPGTYAYLFNSGGIPVHAWGLEYVASVGYLGAALLVAVVGKSYWTSRKSGVSRKTSSRSALWNATTAVSLLPSLVLSTHQWNAWAWLVVSLWACSYLLDGPLHSRDSTALAPAKNPVSVQATE